MTVATARKGPTPSSPRPTEIPAATADTESPTPDGDGVEGPHHPAGAATPPPGPHAATATDLAPRWRLAATGYLLVLAGFALALLIPRLRIGHHDQALVILSIASLLTGTLTVLAAFVLNLLR